MTAAFTALPTPYRVVLVVTAVFAAKALGTSLPVFVSEGLGAGLADRDFANYWIAARLVLGGSASDLFGPQPDYFAHMTAAFGPDYPWHNWSYPPHYLLLIWPLGLMGYEVAMLLFLVVTGGFFAWSLRLFHKAGWSLALVAAAPVVAYNVWTAQNGMLTAGLAVAALALRERRPVVAGLFLGLLTVKPQLGVLFPLLLLAERRWTMLASATMTTAGLAALSAALFGIGAWRGYMQEVLPYQALVMRELGGSFVYMLPSVFGSFRVWDVPSGTALLLHAGVAAPALLAVSAGFVLVKDARWRAAVLMVATFLVTPYALTYDLGLMAAALPVLMLSGHSTAPAKAEQWLLAVAMMLPILTMPLGQLGVPAAPLVVAAVLVLTLRRAGMFERVSGRFPRPAGTLQPPVRTGQPRQVV